MQQNVCNGMDNCRWWRGSMVEDAKLRLIAMFLFSILKKATGVFPVVLFMPAIFSGAGPI